MELWFSENHTKNVKLSIKVTKQLYSGKSQYQRIDVYESKEYGRFITLDGNLMFTEKDEFIYHEMMVHVPMAVHPSPKNVLVVGAGDGGVIRELVKYGTLERIDLVEMDKQVIEVCRKYMRTTGRALDDERVSVKIADGMKFIRRCENEYDIIIVDSLDPMGKGEGLFTKEFYGTCCNALTIDGIMVNQHESAFYKNEAAAMVRTHKKIKDAFRISRVYQAHIPTYPSGHWLFGFASKAYHPIKDINNEWRELGIITRYYNTNLHRGAFALPTYVEEMLKSVE